MSANVQTGKTRTVRYCGADYTILPGEQHGQKQAWELYCNGERIRRFVLTLPKCVFYIHEHATQSGRYPARLPDGRSYQQLISAIR